jgi:sugar phosphate isomerase/epimerase
MNTEKQAQQTLAAIRSAGYDGIELCGFMIHPMGMVIRLLTQAAGMPVGKGGNLNWHKLIKGSGLEVTSLHLDLVTLEKGISACAEEARSFGTKYIVITGMYRFDYSEETAVKELAQRLNKAGEVLKNEGISLLYHNHNAELLKTKSGRCAYEILIEETDPAFVNFEFDSYWFTDGGADAKVWMRKLGTRMKKWHVTDRGFRNTKKAITPILKADSMELGTGNMDLDGLKEIALANGIDAVVLESHKNWIDKDPLKSLELSAKWLNRRFK